MLVLVRTATCSDHQLALQYLQYDNLHVSRASLLRAFWCTSNEITALRLLRISHDLTIHDAHDFSPCLKFVDKSLPPLLFSLLFLRYHLLYIRPSLENFSNFFQSSSQKLVSARRW